MDGADGDPVSRADLYDQLSVVVTTTNRDTLPAPYTYRVVNASFTTLADGPNGEKRGRIDVARDRYGTST